MTAEAQNFTIGDDEGDVDQKNELFFENLYQSLGTATVTLRRADNNAAISGAEFELYKGDSLIESGITDANGKVTFGSTDKLSAGTYTVRQISTSDGLETAADQTFTIRDDNDPDQRESLNFVNEEVSGNVTIRLYRKGGLGKWNWFLGEEYTGLKPNRTYRFTANVQSGMYPDRIRYCVIEGDIQDATSTSNEQELNSQGFNGNTYTFTFTPPENDKVYNLVLIANNWGVEGITDYRMVSTLGSTARPTVNSSPRRMAKAANRGGLKASAITDAQPHKVPEELADEYIEDAAFTVKTYTITSEDENWSYTFPAEDKYDADGNEYYYYIVETGHTPSNYWIEEYEGDPLSETGTIKVTNKQTPGALTITKDVTVDNGAVPADMKTAADGTYTFVITGPNSYSRTETITVTNGVATGSIVLEDLIPGDYTITETGSTNTNGISLDDPKTITVASGSQASANVAAFTNNLVTTDLMVLKVDVNGMTKPLPGAKFEIRRIDGDSETINYIGSASDPITTGDDGIATFTKLVTGYYEVWEKDPPPGYILTDSGKFYVKVEAGAVTAILQTESTAPKDWPSRPDEDHFKFSAAAKTAKVGNEPGAALPHTGGFGTMLYYLMGLMLIALAGIGIVMKRRLVR